MRKHINQALKILNKIFSDGTYSNMALNENAVSDMSTKLVYGVLENNVKIEYILSQLFEKKPQNFIYVLLKIGVYALTELSDVPSFAVVSECVEVTKLNGKSGASGFVNAVLKKVADKKYVLPSESDDNYLSVTYSKPKWFVDKMIERYGIDATLKVLRDDNSEFEHIRVNGRLSSLDEVKSVLRNSGTSFFESAVGGLIVRADTAIKKMFAQGLVTYQSPSSMTAVIALAPTDGAKILDVCSAPGGKAIYMSELCPHSRITACDLYDHRVSLIQKYATRMHAPNVKAVKNDATKFVPQWENAFDFVLVDAPCSCFGTYKKHPDVFLTRNFNSVADLSKVQKSILENSSGYVCKGGVLLYSTCTLFDEENSDVVEWFLKGHTDFSLEKITGAERIDDVYGDNVGKIQILPHGEYDGFFIARMRKSNE